MGFYANKMCSFDFFGEKNLNRPCLLYIQFKPFEYIKGVASITSLYHCLLVLNDS